MRGWLIVDKPEGVTSAQVVRVVKRKFDGLKIGHAGTLDPLASGVLPLALGEATKTVSYVVSTQKGYTFDLVWGEQRSTDDEEGEIIAHSSNRPTLQAVENALPAFTGDILQKPPLYSALKIKGSRACDLMRQGKGVDLKARPVRVDAFECVGGDTGPQVGVVESQATTPVKVTKDLIPMGHEAECRAPLKDAATPFRVLCGPGTYVRSLARDLAHALGTVGYARHIRRYKVGRFEENSSVSLEKIEKLGKRELIENYMLSLETVLDDIPALVFSTSEREKLCLGQAVEIGRDRESLFHKGEGDGSRDRTAVCWGPDNLIFAMGRYADGYVKPVRILK